MSLNKLRCFLMWHSCCVSMYSKVCPPPLSLPALHCGVYTRLFVLCTDIFGCQSLFVCVGVQFLFVFLTLSSPSCVASRSCPIGSHILSVIIIIIIWLVKRHKGRGGEGSDGSNLFDLLVVHAR